MPSNAAIHPPQRLPQRTLAILAFHKIGPAPDDWETWFYIPQSIFLGHLRHLREAGWQVINAATLLRGLSEPECLPERSAVITFDDGYRSLLDYGLPELEEFGFPAILFIPTGYIGGYNRFDADNEPEERVCGWADLRELERRGVSVQSHSVTHRRFSELSPAEQSEELTRSRWVLEDGLGKPVEVFSYPEGDCGEDSDAARVAARAAGYTAACLYGGEPEHLPGADPYRLQRLAMGPDTDLAAELQTRKPVASRGRGGD